MTTTETEKDWWAPIWSGLVLDPKHQMRMDRAIWVYLYLQTYADRKTGRLFRKYQAIADETGRSFNTIRRHMEKLSSLGYIELNRKQYGFEIQITKWKPITTPKLVSKDGQCESNESFRVPIRGQSEIGQTAHREVSECPSVTSRLPKGGHSLNRKCKERKENINKAVVATGSVDIEIDRFLKFANTSHKKLCDCDLFDSGESDREKVRGMLEKTPLQTLCVAWVLFLRTDNPYIVEHYPSRNIAIFKAQLRNFDFAAQSKLTGVRARREERSRTKVPVVRVDSVQAENWDKCLVEIEAQILPENYSALFESLVFRGVKQGRGEILCPSKKYQVYLSENYGELIKTTMANVFGETVSPVFLQDTG
jgi:hypothetical protein